MAIELDAALEALIGGKTASSVTGTDKVPAIRSGDLVAVDEVGQGGVTDYNELDNLPTLGTAAAEDVEAFDPAGSATTAAGVVAEDLLTHVTQEDNAHTIGAILGLSAALDEKADVASAVQFVVYDETEGWPACPDLGVSGVVIGFNSVDDTGFDGLLGTDPGEYPTGRSFALVNTADE